MPITTENKILIKNLFTLEDYNAKQLVREFLSKGWKIGSVHKLLQKRDRLTLVPAAADDSAPTRLITLMFVDELMLHKNS